MKKKEGKPVPRGGARVRSGPPKKALKERIEEGNVSHRPLKLIHFSEKSGENTSTSKPNVSKRLTEKQKSGIKLHTKEIYDAAWKWIDERECSQFISPQLLERYAMASARWVQCEQHLSREGLVVTQKRTNVKNNTETVIEAPSPYATLADRYLSQANRLWSEIFAIIRENSLSDYSGKTPQEDVMEKLLRAPKKENVV